MSACLSPAFPTATTSMPGLLITEVPPAGKWTERLWEGGRDERQFEKMQAMSRSYLAVCKNKDRDRL